MAGDKESSATNRQSTSHSICNDVTSWKSQHWSLYTHCVCSLMLRGFELCKRRGCKELSGWARARLSWVSCSKYVAVSRFQHFISSAASGVMTCATLHVNSWAIHLQVNLRRVIPMLA